MERKSDEEIKRSERSEKHADRRAVADLVAKEFGERVVALRGRIKGDDGSPLSQEELARRAGVDRSALSSIELGGRCSRLDTLVRLAGVLEVTTDELVRGMNWTPDGTGKGELDIEETIRSGDQSPDAPIRPD